MDEPKTLLAIVGPTASGKTRLAVRLARRLNGEVVSADSRQVYRGLNIGSGKDRAEYGRVPVHLLDVASPRRIFTAAQYQRLARRAIADIHRRGKLPILCGGSGLYVAAITRGLSLPASKPDAALRRELAQQTLPQLLARLHQLDARAWQTVDRRNRRRVERAIETVAHTRRPLAASRRTSALPYRIIAIGLNPGLAQLKRRIERRLKQRLRGGLVAEVRRLRAGGVTGRRLEQLGLEYGWASRYLRGQLTRAQLERGLARAIYQFARRQLTWFRREPNLSWFASPAAAAVAARRALDVGS